MSRFSWFRPPMAHQRCMCECCIQKAPVFSHITFCYCIYSPHPEGRSLKTLCVVGERCCKSFSAGGQCGITAEPTETPNKVEAQTFYKMKRLKNVFPGCLLGPRPQGERLQSSKRMCIFQKQVQENPPTAPDSHLSLLVPVLVQSSRTGPYWTGPADLGLRILLYY